jgi:hypothetical protein
MNRLIAAKPSFLNSDSMRAASSPCSPPRRPHRPRSSTNSIERIFHCDTARPGGPTEIHSWIGTIFTEFRELELRLPMGKLGASLSESVVGKLSAALHPGR